MGKRSNVIESTKSFISSCQTKYTSLKDNLSAADKSDRTSRRHKRESRIEPLESRYVLSAIFPAFINGVLTFGDPNLEAPYGLENTFLLESNPTATKTIYLDYDGHHSVNNSWNHNIVFPAFDRDGDPNTFSFLELVEIQRNWQNVAEDFLPFDVNVTTRFPGLDKLMKSGPNDTHWGVRALQTQPTDGFGQGIGGVALLNSFDSSRDDPVFTFNKGINNGAMTISHEVGHALGLRHDGLFGQSYHPGVGTGPTSWGPIMGAPFNRILTQWSRGEYEGANNFEDDVLVITRPRNGFGFRADDHGNDIFSATPLTISNNIQASGWGFIGHQTDIDFFQFYTGSGTISFDIRPFQGTPNLDILARLYDSAGNVIASSNPVDDTFAEFNMTLAEGNYYLSIEGTGKPGVYTDYGSLGFYTIVGTIVDPPIPPVGSTVVIGESGLLELSSRWQMVHLQHSYVDPVVVFGAAGFNDPDPFVIRVQNVTSNSFQVRIQEWGYLDGFHPFETVSYVVMESGVHVLDDGSVIHAFNESQVNHLWKSVSFATSFSGTPIVLSQTVTRNGGEAVLTRMRDVTATGFQVRLQEEEAADGVHAFETVSYIAILPGVGELGGRTFQAAIAPEAITHRPYDLLFDAPFSDTPAFFAAMQTFAGADPANVRALFWNPAMARIFLQEEQSFDREVAHVPEVVGFFAVDPGVIRVSAPIGEAGVVQNLSTQWVTVQLSRTYNDPIVVFGPPSMNDPQAVTVRVRLVTQSSFQVRLEGWVSGPHSAENVGYMVVERGVHRLPGGALIMADSASVDHNWRFVEFNRSFGQVPIVMSQMMTVEGPQAANTRHSLVGPSGFAVRLQEAEIADGTHRPERVGWIAIAPGRGEVGNQRYEADLVFNMTDAITQIDFTTLFRATPVLLGAVQTFDDSDPVALRRIQLTTSVVTMFLQEETTFDPETTHGPERVGYWAIEPGRTAGATFSSVGGVTVLAFTSPWGAYSMMAVPKITYVPSKLVIEETWLPLALPHHMHDHDHDHDDHDGDDSRFAQTPAAIDLLFRVRASESMAHINRSDRFSGATGLPTESVRGEAHEQQNIVARASNVAAGAIRKSSLLRQADVGQRSLSDAAASRVEHSLLGDRLATFGLGSLRAQLAAIDAVFSQT